MDHLQFRYPNDNTCSLDNNGLDSDLVINDDDDWPLPTGLEESGIPEEPDVEEDRQEHPRMSPTPPIIVQPQRRPKSHRPTPSHILVSILVCSCLRLLCELCWLPASPFLCCSHSRPGYNTCKGTWCCHLWISKWC